MLKIRYAKKSGMLKNRYAKKPVWLLDTWAWRGVGRRYRFFSIPEFLAYLIFNIPGFICKPDFYIKKLAINRPWRPICYLVNSPFGLLGNVI